MMLLAADASAQVQRGPADEFGQEQPQVQQSVPPPACPPLAAPRLEHKRVTAVEAIKGGAELGALLGGLTGNRKGLVIGTLAGGVAGLIWERTAQHPQQDLPPATQQ